MVSGTQTVQHTNPNAVIEASRNKDFNEDSILEIEMLPGNFRTTPAAATEGDTPFGDDLLSVAPTAPEKLQTRDAVVQPPVERQGRAGTPAAPDSKVLYERVIREVKMTYDLAAVLRQHGIDLKRGASGFWVANCPFPNHADSSPSFKIKIADGMVYCCYGCQAKGDVLDFIRDYHHLSNVTEAIKYLTGKTVLELWNGLHNGEKPKNNTGNLPSAIKPERSPEITKTAEQIEADLANATDVYIGLLGLLGLDAVHEEQLRQRGIKVSEALQLGYRSFPSKRRTRMEICKQLRAAGYELKSVPGFFRLPPRDYSKGQWCLGGDRWGFRDIKDTESNIFEVTGLLIPTRDLDGRIRRLKVRNDAPDETLPEAVKSRFPERYMAFSSTDRSEGASAGAWVHVARPLYPQSSMQSVIWVTEGEIKADIAALFLGETVLGMPGVGQCPLLAVEAAKNGGFREVCVAMDSEEKPHVKLAVAKLIKVAKEAGLETSVAVWSAEKGKGLDDLLSGGGAPEVLSAENWWAKLSREHQGYVLERINGRGAVK